MNSICSFLLKVLLSFIILCLLAMPRPGFALSSKAQVMLSTSLYGTVGGTLLGMASLAYGTNVRSVAIGASLGLYAGLIFGGYLLTSHYFKKQSRSPSYEMEDGGGQAYLEPERERSLFRVEGGPPHKEKDLTLLYVPVVTIRF